MPSPLFILLPGLHGTDGLWKPFTAVLPDEFGRIAVAYPTDRPLSHQQAIELIEQSVPRDRPLVVLGESFSGPLAIEFAARRGSQVSLLVLCATFIFAPWAPVLCNVGAIAARWLPRNLLALRGILLDWHGHDDITRLARAEVDKVHPDVMADRLQQVARCDASAPLHRVAAPIVYLRAMRDVVVGSRSLAQIRAIRPDTHIAEIDSTHMLLQTCPAEAWRAIELALRRCGPRPSPRP